LKAFFKPPSLVASVRRQRFCGWPVPRREGRRTVGWFFEIKDNRPKRQKTPGAINLPESARQAENQLFDARLATAKTLWESASAAQRQKWLAQMDTVATTMAPKDGAEPRRAFLSCLVSLLEPELPLS